MRTVKLVFWPENYLRNLEQFRFLRAARLANLKDSVGLILDKAFGTRVTIPLKRVGRFGRGAPRYVNPFRSVLPEHVISGTVRLLFCRT